MTHSRKKSRKQGHEEALREYFEAIIERYQKEGWDIIFPDASSEVHPKVGSDGHMVFFRDAQDVAELLPPEEEQTNNRGEVVAALATLLG